MAKLLLELASEIIAAQANHIPMTSKEILDEVRCIYKVLQELQALEAELSPTMRRLDSIQHHQVICIECDRGFKLLSNRHLAQHGLTSRDYKVKYGLPLCQPLTAKSLSQTRRKIAKEKGLGANLVAFRRRAKALQPN